MVKAKYPYQNLSLKNLKGELWDDLPQLDGAYEISNYGRVKAKRRFAERQYNGGYWVKEKILKQRKSIQIVSEGKRKLYRLSVTISYDGKKYSCQIARMVYYLFVKKFDLENRKIKVSAKDEDPFHIRPDNLMLTSTDVYMKKAYVLNRRKRESFGNKGKEISQYDFKGKWINSYPSISVAAQAVSGSSGQILKSVNEKEGFASGFIWRYGNRKTNLSRIPKRVKKKIASDHFHASLVSCYDLKGHKIREYKNLKAAARSLNIQPNSIRKVIIGKSISAKEYYWKLGSGPQQISMNLVEKRIEKARSKILRPVTQYALNGKIISSYESIMAAARATGLHNMNISGALKSQGKHTAGDYLWIYGNGSVKMKVNPRIKRKYELRKIYTKPVTQYSLDGDRIEIHDTLLKAAKNLKIAASFLADAAMGKSLSYSGFYWQLGKGSEIIKMKARAIAEKKRLKKLSKPVIQFDMSGKIIKEFLSIGEATRLTNTSANQIRLVALGKYNSAKGYTWKFKEKYSETPK